MNVIKHVSNDLKKRNPYYWKLMKAATTLFLLCIFFFAVNLIGIWLDSEIIRIISMLSIAISLFGAIFCYLGMGILIFISFFKKLS